MMKNKLIKTSALSLSLLLATGSTAFALYDPNAMPYTGPLDSQVEAGAEIDAYTPMLITTEVENTMAVEAINLSSVRMDLVIKEVNLENNYILATDANEIDTMLRFSEDTAIVDDETKNVVAIESLKEDDSIVAFVSPASTMSIPAQTSVFGIVTNVNEDSEPVHFHAVEDVTINEDGSATITTDNGNLVLTIGSATFTKLYDEEFMITKPSHFEVGSTFFAWYGMTTRSIPAQAYATSAVLIPNVEEDEDAIMVADYAYRLGTQGSVVSIEENVLTLKNEADQEVRFLIENTAIVDNETAVGTSIATIEEGSEVYVYHKDAHDANMPNEFYAEAILTNIDEVAPAKYITAEQVTKNSDDTVFVTGEAGSLILEVAADAQIMPYLTRNIVRNTDIYMGTDILVWHNEVMESYPMQTSAEKVVILPDTNYDFTIVREGDIAIAKGRVEDGVAMVPLRLVAESLGYEVTWDGSNNSIKLVGDVNSSNIVLGEDTFSYYSTQTGDEVLASHTAPMYLGAPNYAIDGVTYVPAEFFNMLGFNLRLNGTTLYM